MKPIRSSMMIHPAVNIMTRIIIEYWLLYMNTHMTILSLNIAIIYMPSVVQYFQF